MLNELENRYRLELYERFDQQRIFEYFQDRLKEKQQQQQQQQHSQVGFLFLYFMCSVIAIALSDQLLSLLLQMGGVLHVAVVALDHIVQQLNDPNPSLREHLRHRLREYTRLQ